jgi:5-methylcytosine-specific restriction endonuclease McrA
MAFSKKQREVIHKKLDGYCGYCGKVITIKEMQVDHMQPRSRPFNLSKDYNWGLHNQPDNLMPTCRRCNHYKRDSTVEEFRRDMKTLHERLQKIYIVKVGIDFGMMDIKPFDGKFYFEKLS